jgi:hypothetical protein
MKEAMEAHRSLETLGLPHFVHNRLTDGGEGCQPYAPTGHPLLSGMFLVLISVRD